MKTKRFFLVLVSVLMLSIVFVGCGKKDFGFNVFHDSSMGTVAGNYKDLYEKVEDVVVVAKPKEGCEFVYWKDYYTGAQISTNATYAFTIKKDTALHAVFRRIPYAITLKINNKEQTVVANYGVKSLELENIFNNINETGYKVDGLYYDADGVKTKYDVSKSYPFTKDLTLTAMFSKKTYVVKFGEFEVENVHIGDIISNISDKTLTKTGHIFDGWFNSGLEWENGLTISALHLANEIEVGGKHVVNLTAKFTQKKYILSIDKSGTVDSNIPNELKIVYGENIPSFFFKESDTVVYTWKIKGSDVVFTSNSKLFLIDFEENLTFEKKLVLSVENFQVFEFLNQNTVFKTVKVAKNETLFLNELTIGTPEKTGYSFDHWELNQVKTEFVTYSGVVKQVLKSVFAPNEQKVVYHANNGTGLTETSNTFFDVENFPVENNGGSFSKNFYVFKGWALDANSTIVEYAVGDTILKIQADINLYAVWEKIEYTLTLQSESKTITATIRAGEEIIIDKIAGEKAYYVCVGFGKNGNLFDISTASNELLMLSDENRIVLLTAIYEKIEYTINIYSANNTLIKSLQIGTESKVGSLKEIYKPMQKTIVTSGKDGAGTVFNLKEGEIIDNGVLDLAKGSTIIALYAKTESIDYNILISFEDKNYPNFKYDALKVLGYDKTTHKISIDEIQIFLDDINNHVISFDEVGKGLVYEDGTVGDNEGAMNVQTRKAVGVEVLTENFELRQTSDGKYYELVYVGAKENFNPEIVSIDIAPVFEESINAMVRKVDENGIFVGKYFTIVFNKYGYVENKTAFDYLDVAQNTEIYTYGLMVFDKKTKTFVAVEEGALNNFKLMPNEIYILTYKNK